MADTNWFGEPATVERTPIFTLNSIDPLSDLRNVVTGTPTDTSEEYVLNSGDKIESAEFGRYIPGYAAQAGVGVRVSTAPTGSQVLRWGIYDDDNGFFFEQDSSGVYTVVRRSGTDTRTAQTSWNVDTADGVIDSESQSGFNLDTSRGAVYQIEWAWYGYGQIEYQIVDNRYNTSARQRTIAVHRASFSGQTSIVNPNLPITVENTGAGDGVIAVGGRQYSIIGRYAPPRRAFAKTRTVTGVGTSFTPIIALRRKNNTDAAHTKIRVSGVTAMVDADMQIGLVTNPTVTFGTAVDGDLDGNSESATEFSVNPSSYSIGDGEPLLNVLVDAAGTGSNSNGSEQFAGLSDPITRLRPVVLVARALDGTADITALVRVTEEW